MSDDNEAPKPTQKFIYPFPVPDTSNGNQDNTIEATDPKTYYDALARAEDGFYPIGYNGQWHGGIHFDGQTRDTLAQGAGVRCIADGEVIAWKVDDDYPTVEYDTCGAATYSTGFVLVRHRLQLPGADRAQADGAGEASGANQGRNAQQQEPSLVFYSLYMHLLNWKGYQQHADKAKPAFWGESIYLVGERANDADRTLNPHIPEGGVGLNLRDAAASTRIGFAPRGTQLRLGQQSTATGYRAVTEVVSGSVLPAGLTGAYAFLGELTPMPVEPPAKDEIVIPDTPIAVAAGELVGHPGQYQRYIDMNPLGSSCNERELMQVDVFATGDVEAFIAQSRERAAQLADRHKTLLLVEKGARLVRAPEGEGQLTGEQLAARRGNADGPEAAHPRVVPVKALGEAVAEEDGTRWWNVEVGTDDGESAWGWVRERDHVNVRLCTPWDWPGFEITKIDDTRPDQFYANQVVRQGHATPDEQADLQQRGESVEMGPLFRKLYDLIDLDNDKKIISTEMRQALAKPWLAQAISHLIVRHESEWSGPMDKWKQVDDLIPEKRKKDWEKEKERIESLLWWGEVKGNHGLPESQPLIAYNFHPVGFVTNFFSRAIDCITYRIHFDGGLIQRIVPSVIASNKSSIARYIYVDRTGGEHELGEYTFTTVRTVGAENRVIAGNSYLVDLRTVEDYSNGDIRFGFHYDERLTLRPYIGMTPLASLFGAMLEVGYEDFSCNGFSNQLGHSIGGSSSHRNGINGDLKYLRLDGTTQTQTSLHINVQPELMDEARQNAFNDALVKFGWGNLLAWLYQINGESRLLNHTRHFVNHHHHLHLQGYAPNLEEIHE